MSEALPIIWLLGAKKSEARELHQLLAGAGELAVESVPLRPALDDYADLAANHDTGAVLISDTLKRRTDGVYSSAKLADFLRTLRPELPIYIVAEDDADDDVPAVDGVISVKGLRRQPDLYSSRLLRAVGRYRAALSDQQRRMQELLDRHVAGQLDAASAAELAELRALGERAAQVKMAKHANAQEQDLAERRQMISQLEAIAARLERRSR